MPGGRANQIATTGSRDGYQPTFDIQRIIFALKYIPLTYAIFLELRYEKVGNAIYIVL